MRVRRAQGRNCLPPIAFDSQRIDVMHISIGAAHMTQYFLATRRHPSRASIALAFAGALFLSSSMVSAAHAQSLNYAPNDPGAFPQGYVNDEAVPQDEDSALPDRLRRQVV